MLVYRYGYLALFRNVGGTRPGGTRFEDITEKAGLRRWVNSNGAIWLDYDRDGWPDIVKTNFSDDTNNLYHNDRKGEFTDVAGAAGIGQIKVSKGQVAVEREGKTLSGAVGTRLETADTVRTGADGSVGITMDDDSLLSVGPNSVLSLERYTFDPTTNRGRFDSALNKGTLAVISGFTCASASRIVTRTSTMALARSADGKIWRSRPL